MYLNKFFNMHAIGATELDCSGSNTAGVHVMDATNVARIEVLVSTVMVSTTPIVITVKRRPTYGTATGEVTISTLSIPATQAVGGVIYKDLAGTVNLAPGEGLSFAVTTVATTSGKVLVGFVGLEDPETPANQSKMIASA